MPPRHVLLAGLLLPAFVACNALFGIEDLVLDPGTTGATGGESAGGSEASTGGGGTSEGGRGGAASGGGSGGGSGGQGAAGPGLLADTGLLARYYFDEAAADQNPSAVLDHAADPLDVPIYYDGGLTYVALTTGRGLRWGAGTEGRAMVSVSNTKLRNQLTGSKTATLEIVFEAISPNVDFALLAQIMPVSGPNGRLGAGLQEDPFPSFEFNDTTNQSDVNGLWDVGVVGVGRVVSHFVLNTDESQALDRVRMFNNGEEAAPLSRPRFVSSPKAGETIDICDACWLTLGNMPVTDRPLHGALFYVAIYTSALTVDEIQNNVSVLLLDDDAPLPRSP